MLLTHVNSFHVLKILKTIFNPGTDNVTKSSTFVTEEMQPICES